MAFPEKHIRELLPTTMEELRAVIQRREKRNENFDKCESPIEHDFLHCFYKVKSKEVSISGQENCQTRSGRFRLDFVMTIGNRKIALECDGKQFHDAERDQRRDEAILETGFVDTIYRVPGRSLWFYTNDVLDLLRFVEPSLFDERGNQLLDAILDDGAKREDDWSQGFGLRALSRRKLAEDGEVEEGEIEYKSPHYISLKWKRKNNLN